MSAKRLDAADCLEAVRLVRALGSIQAAAESLNLPRTTFVHRYRTGLMMESNGDIQDVAEKLDEVQFLRDRIRTLEATIRTNNREALSAEYIKRAIIKLAEQPISPPEWTVAETPPGEPGVPVTIWSDWHIGEVVRPEEVNGVNEFNIEVAHRRVQRLVSKTIDLLMKHTVHSKPYPGIVVCLGGDMVSGDIHDELRETNEKPIMPVVIETVGLLHWAIRTLADHFGQVFVPCVTGNHGRNTLKPRHAGRVWTSFDWLIYQFLAKGFEGDNRVQFLIGEGADVLFKVHDHTYLLTHGDNLARGGDGQIGHFGPVIRGTQRRQVRNQAIGQEFETLLAGHWHQLTMTPRFIVNGSLVGPATYAHNLAYSYEKPQQALWLSHPTRGVTMCLPVFLEDGKPYRTQSGKWVSWPKTQ